MVVTASQTTWLLTGNEKRLPNNIIYALENERQQFNNLKNITDNYLPKHTVSFHFDSLYCFPLLQQYVSEQADDRPHLIIHFFF